MSTTAWAHLPNAAHIDWVLHTLHSHSQVWVAAWDNTRDAAWGGARAAAWDAARAAAHAAAHAAARDTAWDTTWDTTWDAIWGAACDDVWNAAWNAAWDDARGATHALIAWDDAGRWLRTHWSAAHMAADAGDHAAVLLLPAAHVAWELGYSRQTEEMI